MITIKTCIKMTHGFNGGSTGATRTIIRIFILLILLFSCAKKKEKTENSQIYKDCKYRFYSFATKEETFEEYQLKLFKDEKYITASYFKLDSAYTFLYQLSKDKKKLKMKFNENEEDCFEFISERSIKAGKEIVVQCFALKNVDDGPNMFVFWNDDFGVILANITDCSRELISFNKDSTGIKQIIDQIKADSIFYEDGGKQWILPPGSNT